MLVFTSEVIWAMIIALAAISAAITAVAEAMAWIRLAASAEISDINNFLKLGMFIGRMLWCGYKSSQEG